MLLGSHGRTLCLPVVCCLYSFIATAARCFLFVHAHPAITAIARPDIAFTAHRRPRRCRYQNMTYTMTPAFSAGATVRPSMFEYFLIEFASALVSGHHEQQLFAQNTVYLVAHPCPALRVVHRLLHRWVSKVLLRDYIKYFLTPNPEAIESQVRRLLSPPSILTCLPAARVAFSFLREH